MSAQSIAYLYVYYLEPMFKVAVWLGLLVVVLYIVNMITDGKKKGDIINSLFSTMVSMIKGVFIYGGKGILVTGKLLLRIITILIDTVRDFFTSKI